MATQMLPNGERKAFFGWWSDFALEQFPIIIFWWWIFKEQNKIHCWELVEFNKNSNEFDENETSMNSIKTQINFRFKAQTQNQITLKLRNYLITKLH